jgi:hypothetical protein
MNIHQCSYTPLLDADEADQLSLYRPRFASGPLHFAGLAIVRLTDVIFQIKHEGGGTPAKNHRIRARPVVFQLFRHRGGCSADIAGLECKEEALRSIFSIVLYNANRFRRG